VPKGIEIEGFQLGAGPVDNRRLGDRLEVLFLRWTPKVGQNLAVA
jgi:hypothetical protein